MPTQDTTDRELLTRWLSGDATAGRQLRCRNDPELLRFFTSKVRPLERDTLAEQVWSSAVQTGQHAAQLRSVGATVAELPCPVHSTFRAYLLGVARRALYRHYQQLCGARRFEPEIDSVTTLIPAVGHASARELPATPVGQALWSLPVELQLLAEARYCRGFTHPELAEAFELSEQAVRTRLECARSRLRPTLAGP